MAIFHLGIHPKKSEFWGDFFPLPPPAAPLEKCSFLAFFAPKSPPVTSWAPLCVSPLGIFLDFREFSPPKKSLNFPLIFLRISEHQGGL